MKISKQEEYGLRCILQLARSGAGSSMSVTEIAKCEGLSADNVTKLMVMLRKANLVVSVRGINGGYELKRTPDRISLGDVMRALGGFFYPKDLCNEYPGKLAECSHLGGCGIRPVWAVLSRQISLVLNRTSLMDLLKEEREVERLMVQHVPKPVLVSSPN